METAPAGVETPPAETAEPVDEEGVVEPEPGDRHRTRRSFLLEDAASTRSVIILVFPPVDGVSHVERAILAARAMPPRPRLVCLLHYDLGLLLGLL